MASWRLLSCTVSQLHNGHDTLELTLCIYQVAQVMHIQVFAHVVNASMIVFIISLASTALYIASRTLWGLAHMGQAPRVFGKVSARKIPVRAVIVCLLFSFLVFMNLGSQDGAIAKPSSGLTTYIFEQPSTTWPMRQ